MKNIELSIRVTDGQIECAVINGNRIFGLERLIAIGLSITKISIEWDAAIKAAREYLGGTYANDGADNLFGSEDERPMKNGFVYDMQPIEVAHQKLTGAIQAAADAAAQFRSKLVPDGDYTVSTGVVKIK